MTTVPTLSRDALTKALNGDRRLVQAFEQQAQVITENQEATSLQVEATQALQDATVLVLSPNATFNNERVLRLGEGITAIDDGTYLTLSVNDRFAHVAGGFRAELTAQGDTNVVLPLDGVLATVDGYEELTNKTLEAAVLNQPKITGLVEYADDVAAATGGVAIGGIYRTASALKVRVS